MTLSQEIIGYATNLFDVAGFARLPDKKVLLIVGLETTPKYDLDEFHRIDGNFQITGFEKHAKPRLESLLTFIRKRDSPTELIGRCGYPLKGEVNLKEAAVLAGLGRWGKSTVVLHHRCGNRLRFMAIKTEVQSEFPANCTDIREENPDCIRCNKCIECCPVGILKPYKMPETKNCLANISNKPGNDGRLLTCDICLRVCPANVDMSK